MVGFDIAVTDQEEFFLSHQNPVVLELNRLKNQLTEKEKELAGGQSEIKALKANEVMKDKALEELRKEVDKLDKKILVTENLVEQKNLEIKKATNQKKDALGAQYAAEATLRRVHASLKDDEHVPIESVIAPLEAEIKIYKNEIASLQENNKVLERHTKLKEVALLEAEKIMKSALERALIVEEVQNHNFELKRQIEICQEENRILEKNKRQKVMEVEKLSHTIKELEEAVLSGGAAANAVRDYRRQVSELHEEKRTLERELGRAKVSANRVATVVANEWKDENDKVMPIKLWLEERKLLQADVQRLKDKLAISERTVKAEAQLKDKLKLRLKTLEEGLKQVSSFSINPSALCGTPKTEKSNNGIFGFLTGNGGGGGGGGARKRSTSQPRASTTGNSYSPKPNMLNDTKRYVSGENMVRKGIWASRSKVVDSSGKENAELKTNTDTTLNKDDDNVVCRDDANGEAENKREYSVEGEDNVSGFLYDRVQKEVINLRKTCEVKDGSLSAKDKEIKVLTKKICALTKALEVESKRVKREAAAAAKERDILSAKVNDSKKVRDTTSSKRFL